MNKNQLVLLTPKQRMDAFSLKADRAVADGIIDSLYEKKVSETDVCWTDDSI